MRPLVVPNIHRHRQTMRGVRLARGFRRSVGATLRVALLEVEPLRGSAAEPLD